MVVGWGESAHTGEREPERERERERARERESARTHKGERVQEKALWLLLCFFLHLGLPYANWA